MRYLIVGVQLAVVHIAESEEEAAEVERVAKSLGPVWRFPLEDDEPLQHWADRS